MCETNQLHTLKLGTAIITPPDGLEHKLAQAAKEHRKLVVKLGFDPTAPDLHLGHAVVLKKLREFQTFGHRLVIIIGNFTAQIGDPTGRNKTRPPLSEEEIAQNAETYLNQLSKIIDLDRAEIHFNASWLGDMRLTDVIRLMSKTTVAQLLQREDFANRFTHAIPICMHELLYPLLQGQDSLAIQADVEIGGTDQLFNCLVGRALQEAEGKDGQIVISMPLLVGLDGKEKMSKSKNNIIGLTDPAREMFGKAMSIPDIQLENYLELATDFDIETRNKMKQGLEDCTSHPMDVKKLIAHNIVKQYHGLRAADEATLFFENQFQKRDKMSIIFEQIRADSVFCGTKELGIVDICIALQPALSKSQARRLVISGAVTVNGNKVEDTNMHFSFPEKKSLEIKIGKRGFYAVMAFSE